MCETEIQDQGTGWDLIILQKAKWRFLQVFWRNRLNPTGNLRADIRKNWTSEIRMCNTYRTAKVVRTYIIILPMYLVRNRILDPQRASDE